MRDFLPEDVRRREYVIGVITRTYQRYGFEPLETPALENIETLTGKYGEEGHKLIFKVLRRGEHEGSGETDLALRYDLTVPLARVVAEHRGKLPKFFKRYQIQPVWRADRPARGRFREFYQCDVDAIGSRSMVVEAELCAAVADVLRRLGFDDFVIKLNHRRVLSGILAAAGVPDAIQGSALVALDKLDKIGPDGVGRELADRGVSSSAADVLLATFTGAPDLDRVRDTVAGRPDAASGVEELQQIVRYDGLIGMFLGEDIPACGFSLGLERILVVMAERRMFPADVDAASADLLVTLFDAESIPDSLKLAAELRGAGLRVEVYPEPDKLGKQFKYAAAIAVPRVAILGSDERARGLVTIKDMKTGEQASVPRGEVARRLAPVTVDGS
jgi:histidyl-tRNA synthetase